MKKKYRITKYNPFFRDISGTYLKRDWTSFCDIGNVYFGKILTAAEYLEVEQNYIQSMMLVLQNLGIPEMRIKEPEFCNRNTTDLQRKLTEKGLSLTESQKGFLERVSESEILKAPQLEECFRLQLRECFWCKLVDVCCNAVVWFGYDYYMYIKCDEIAAFLVDEIHKNGLFVEMQDGARWVEL